mgnify:CR=1 FL=1|tara:strand:- start:31063 stop:31743 length:681 start_codon:yes stop_codon:yes gene_type:complete
MSTRKIVGVFLLSIGAAACSKPVAGPAAATHTTTPNSASASEAEETPAEVVPEPANPVRVVGQNGASSQLEVDGDYLLRGMRFPQKMGAFVRGKIVDYNSRALGHSVGYNDPDGITATVYLYGGGGNAEGELTRALHDMAAHPEAPTDLTFLETAPIAIEIEGETVEGYIGIAYSQEANYGSQAIVFSIAGRFLKFRITAPIEVFTARMEEIREIMLSFGRPKFDK